MGAKRGNTNGLKTGVKVTARRLTIGEVPKQLICVRRQARAYRRQLECEVEEAKGSISCLDSHLIDTATAAVIQAGILRWTRRYKFEEMNTEAIEKNGERLLKALAARDAAVKALALDTKPKQITLTDYLSTGSQDANDSAITDTSTPAEDQ